MENDWRSNTNIAFDNPSFDQNEIYVSISPTTASTIQGNLKQTKEGGLPFQDGETNSVSTKPPIEEGNTDYESLDGASKSNPTYGLAHPGASKSWNPQEQDAAIQEKETSYVSLRPTATISKQLCAGDPLQNDAQYLKPEEAQSISSTAMAEVYESVDVDVDVDAKDDSQA